MSAMGQKRTFRRVQPMSALPPKADIAEVEEHVCLVPKADMCCTFAQSVFEPTRFRKGSRQNHVRVTEAWAVLDGLAGGRNSVLVTTALKVAER